MQHPVQASQWAWEPERQKMAGVGFGFVGRVDGEMSTPQLKEQCVCKIGLSQLDPVVFFTCCYHDLPYIL